VVFTFVEAVYILSEYFGGNVEKGRGGGRKERREKVKMKG
jgi:hypothetical protein